jgi:hypothetical protein
VATGADTCGTVTITESDVETASCGNTKTIVRTWTITNECGNSVLLLTKPLPLSIRRDPTIDSSGVSNIDIQCGVTPDGTLGAWIANNAGATAADTCGNVTWSNDYGANTDVDCANGAITVTFTATDDCGNASSVTATYSIIDTVAPVITRPCGRNHRMYRRRIVQQILALATATDDLYSYCSNVSTDIRCGDGCMWKYQNNNKNMDR